MTNLRKFHVLTERIIREYREKNVLKGDGLIFTYRRIAHTSIVLFQTSTQILFDDVVLDILTKSLL